MLKNDLKIVQDGTVKPPRPLSDLATFVGAGKRRKSEQAQRTVRSSERSQS